MRKVTLQISFRDVDGETRTSEFSLDTRDNPDHAGEQRVTHHIFSELTVALISKPLPIHNATARTWLEFPRTIVDLNEYHSVRNSQELWRELCNLVLSTEHDMIDAETFKSLEPIDEPLFKDDAAIESLYFLHSKKVELLDQSVYKLIKVQDLVHRLLHESLGGNLVDASIANWERSELSRPKILAGMNRKLASSDLSQSDFDQIVQALRHPNTPQTDITATYRNRMAHHVHPSVDYSMFYSAVSSRRGEDVLNEQGQIIGTRQIIYDRPPVEYQFATLLQAYRTHLAAIVRMLNDLRAC
jgi:hypothetical protein